MKIKHRCVSIFTACDDEVEISSLPALKVKVINFEYPVSESYWTAFNQEYIFFLTRKCSDF